MADPDQATSSLCTAHIYYAADQRNKARQVLTVTADKIVAPTKKNKSL